MTGMRTSGRSLVGLLVALAFVDRQRPHRSLSARRIRQTQGNTNHEAQPQRYLHRLFLLSGPDRNPGPPLSVASRQTTLRTSRASPSGRSHSLKASCRAGAPMVASTHVHTPCPCVGLDTTLHPVAPQMFTASASAPQRERVSPRPLVDRQRTAILCRYRNHPEQRLRRRTRRDCPVSLLNFASGGESLVTGTAQTTAGGTRHRPSGPRPSACSRAPPRPGLRRQPPGPTPLGVTCPVCAAGA